MTSFDDYKNQLENPSTWCKHFVDGACELKPQCPFHRQIGGQLWNIVAGDFCKYWEQEILKYFIYAAVEGAKYIPLTKAMSEYEARNLFCSLSNREIINIMVVEVDEKGTHVIVEQKTIVPLLRKMSC